MAKLNFSALLLQSRFGTQEKLKHLKQTVVLLNNFEEILSLRIH